MYHIDFLTQCFPSCDEFICANYLETLRTAPWVTKNIATGGTHPSHKSNILVPWPRQCRRKIQYNFFKNRPWTLQTSQRVTTNQSVSQAPLVNSFDLRKLSKKHCELPPESQILETTTTVTNVPYWFPAMQCSVQFIALKSWLTCTFCKNWS